ncbi:TldD/PmbA family protein [Sulfitobacter sp. LCG007]
MTQTLEALTERLLAAARKAGADAADAVAMSGTSLSIEVRAGKLEQAERSEGIDIGLRVLIGQKVANVSASDTRDTTISEMAERAVAMAREALDDPHAGLADPSELARDYDLEALALRDPAPEPSAQALMEDALRAEAAARSHPGISQIEASSAGYGLRHIHLAASNGFSGGFSRSSRGISCVAITGQGTGMERDYDGDSRTFQSDLRSPEDIGRTAAERTMARAGARRPKTGAYPVIFDERVASSLIGHLLSAVNGSAIARGASWLRDALGTQVLPTGISLVEDPHRPRASGSRPFDGEGLATRRRQIVDDGVLTGWTLDLGTARKLGMRSTANAMRGASGGPSPSTWNVTLTPGSASREDLIRDMGTGLLVTSMIGSTINPNTGDYSRGASGLWIENGEVTHAVNEITIAGNLRHMLLGMVPANDARPWLSRVVPSLLVPGITLAGG